MTEREPKTQIFTENPLIFADSPFLLEIQAFGGRRKPQKTADFRRKAQIFAENRRKPQIGLRHLRSVTFSSALCLNQRKKSTPKNLICYASWGPILWPFLRSSARDLTIEAVRGIKGPWFLLRGCPFPLRGHWFPYGGAPFGTTLNSVHTRCIVKTGGCTRGVCKNRGFY